MFIDEWDFYKVETKRKSLNRLKQNAQYGSGDNITPVTPPQLQTNAPVDGLLQTLEAKTKAAKAKIENLSKGRLKTAAMIDQELRRKNEDMRKRIEQCIAKTRQASDAIEAQKKAELEAQERLKREEQDRILREQEAKEEAKRKELQQRIDQQQAQQKAQQQAQLKAEEEARKKKEEAEKAKVEQENAKAEEEKAKQKAAEEKKRVTTGNEDYISSAALKEYEELIAQLNKIKTDAEAYIQQRNLKRWGLQSRTNVKRRIGQVTNDTREIERVAKEISEILDSSKQQGELAYAWLLNRMAKQFAEQAEAEVSVKIEAAFPLAHVIVLILSRHPSFVNIFNARFMKRCPYVVPRYPKKPPPLPSDSEAVTRKKQMKEFRYKEKGDGEYESEERHVERMNGLLAVWLAVAQTKSYVNGVVNPLGMPTVWRWFARLLNMPPRRITPALITTFLQVAGYNFLNTYTSQAQKLISYVESDMIPRIPDKAVAAKTRLELFLKDEYKNFGGRMNPPKGLMPE
ncbi:GLE1-like protein-domain-containing protein [Paraphysoderma sedebokerense]|nr:GLE1-like protein-domain-containing protein [Paraphysoderma sedebokerense]KAI9142972.1 GLE1-like protein-domain-containing protein [Paraphysoderma sedebokerense]